MLARDAESLFWIGRYMERAEDTARLLDVTYHGLLETTAAEERAAWSGVLAAVGLERAFEATGRPLTAIAVCDFLVADRTNRGSIIAAVEQGRENARTVRGWLSTELWSAINSFCLGLRQRNVRTDLEHEPHDLYGFVRRECQAVAGVAHETMARDEGWRFLELGWHLERAEWACRLLRVRQAQLGSSGFHEWVGTLRSASALEAYRRTNRASMDPADVVAFLLLSRTFPRSVLHAVRTAEGSLQLLSPGEPELTRPLRLLGRLRADLEFADVRELMAGDLSAHLFAVEGAIRQVCTAVDLQYFTNSHEFDMHTVSVMPGEQWAS